MCERLPAEESKVVMVSVQKVMVRMILQWSNEVMGCKVKCSMAVS